MDPDDDDDYQLNLAISMSKDDDFSEKLDSDLDYAFALSLQSECEDRTVTHPKLLHSQSSSKNTTSLMKIEVDPDYALALSLQSEFNDEFKKSSSELNLTGNTSLKKREDDPDYTFALSLQSEFNDELKRSPAFTDLTVETGAVGRKRNHSETSTSTPSTSTSTWPSKRSRGEAGPSSYSEAISLTRIAIVKEGFPKEKLNDVEMGLIQCEQLKFVDSAPSGTVLPQIKSHKLIGGAIVFVCHDKSACDWIYEKFSGNIGILKDTILKVTYGPTPIKVSFMTKDIWTKDPGTMLRRLNSYNCSLNTRDWQVLNHSMAAQVSRWLFQIDRDSAIALAECNYSVCTGVDVGSFKILHDPEGITEAEHPATSREQEIPIFEV